MKTYNKVCVDPVSGQGGEEINFVVTKLLLQNQPSQNNILRAIHYF